MQETLDITGWLTSLVGNDPTSLLIVLFIVFFLDSFLVPTLPELFFITMLSYRPSDPQWMLIILLIAIAAEAGGMFTLWFLTTRFTIPNWIKKAVGAYVDYLIIPNEKMVFVNRFAPMLPFTGAFAGIMAWDIRKVLLYNAFGCIVKYGGLALIGGWLYMVLGDNAGIVTIVFTLIIMIIGVCLGIQRKKKRKAELDMEVEHENC